MAKEQITASGSKVRKETRKCVTRGAKSRDDNVGKEETPPEKCMGMTCGMWMAT
jgi:hypothetical protein